MPNAVKLFYMATWRNLLTMTRYKANFVFEILSSVLVGFGMLLFALAFDISMLARTVGSTNYVAFIILGIAFQSWTGIALWGAAGMFQGELSSGQIDYTFTCPFSRYWYIVSNIAASAVQGTLFAAPMLIVGLYFAGSTVTATGIILGFTAALVSVAALAQLGAIFASLVLKYRQVTAIFSFFNFAFQMLTGMFVPLQIMPQALQVAGQALPLTFGMDLLRYYVMKTTPILQVEYEWIALAAQLAVFSVAAKMAVAYIQRTAKEEGLHYI